MKWIWIILALVYLLSPYDLIPGLSAAGWLDDIFVLFLLYRYLARFNRMRQAGLPPLGNQQHTTGDRSREAPEEQPAHRTPYDILGVGPTATTEEIKAAYRRLVNQYHPDKVSHLGEEFQQPK